MADEVEILTTNAAGDSWVDVEPGAVSTGYQNQNTNIEAQRIGIDESTLTWDGGTSELVLEISGVMDENGLPFVVKTEVRLTIASNNTWYIRLIAGSTADKRSVQLTTSPGTWDAALNGYYISGDRVLNWVIVKGTAATPEILRRQNDASGTGLVVDTIIEQTSANGVDIEGVNLKDGAVNVDNINEQASGNGVTIDGVILKDGGVEMSGIAKPRSNPIANAISLDGDSYVFPRGFHVVVQGNYILEAYINSSWQAISSDGGGTIISDGTNFRARNVISADTLRFYTF